MAVGSLREVLLMRMVDRALYRPFHVCSRLNSRKTFRSTESQCLVQPPSSVYDLTQIYLLRPNHLTFNRPALPIVDSVLVLRDLLP